MSTKTPETWLLNLTAKLAGEFSLIKQIYLLVPAVYGSKGTRPNYALLLYAGHDEALELMKQLAPAEEKMRCLEGIVHLYVENYGCNLCGLWGGNVLPREELLQWREEDFVPLVIRNRENTFEERLQRAAAIGDY